MENKQGLTGKQKMVIGTVTSLGMMGLYTGGVNLAKTNPDYHNPIFVGTIIITFVSPYLLKGSITYFLNKYNADKDKKLKK